MKAIDIEGELRELVASEEVLAHFDFTLTLGAGSGARDVEGLCKVSRPRERKSRATYLSLFFIVDSPDDPTRRAIDAQLSRVDWSAFTTPGVDCMMAIPHRHAGAGLFLKEIDAYLDGTHPPSAAFVRDHLLPTISRAVGLRAGELTVWEEDAARAPDAEQATLLSRLRRYTRGS
jgi:hypothetical protein